MNEPISLKLSAMIGSTDQKNWLTFRSDAVPNTDSGSLFHFPHYYRIGDFTRFISISHTVSQSPADFYDIGGNECRQQEQESTTAYIWIGIRIKPEIPIRILDHFC